MTSDDDLFEGLRAELADVRLGTPIEDILASGRRRHRNRRLLPVLGTGTGAVAAVALTLGLVVPGAQPATTHATLTDWSVTAGAHHTVNVSIRDHRETKASMIGLSRALHAAGVPALVKAAPPTNCGPEPVLVKPSGTLRYHKFTKATFRIRVARLRKGAKVVVVVPAIPRAAFTKARAVRVQRQIQVTRPRGRAVPVPAIKAIPPRAKAGVALPQVVVISPAGRCTLVLRPGR